MWIPPDDCEDYERPLSGYKERLSKFQERRKKEGAGVSKRDVQNYLKKQQKEAKQETGSNAMLDALKNIKL